jgi:hypothetical protein
MKILPLALALLALASPAGEGWWNPDWKFRRPLAVRNRLDRPLEKGFTMQVDVDPDYLGMREHSRQDLGDWMLVRRGVRVPALLRPGRGKAVALHFRIPEEIPVGGADAYFLYYGNPQSEPAATAPGEVFEYYEDFSKPESLAERFAVDKDLTCAVQNGALVVREAAAGRPASSPCRIAFRSFPALAGFDLAFDLEMDSAEAAAAGCLLTIEMKEAAAGDESFRRKVDALVEQLGDDAWETREKATHDLIALGRPAVARLSEVLKSADAEVRWRAAHVLKEIAERSPAPLISAGISGGDARSPVALSAVIGKNRSTTRSRSGWPVKTRISVQRDPDGDVKVSWDGRAPQSGSMPGDVREVGFSIYKGTASPLGTIRISNIVVRRFVDDDSRPTSTIDVEETRP